MDSSITLRPATPMDCDGIAEAHVDSIRTLGIKNYPQDVIDDWAGPSTHERGERYAKAMAMGEKLFVAADKNQPGKILGFSAARVEYNKHRIGVYVRSEAARKKIGSDLLRLAETTARQNGATEIYVDASLGAVAFYAKNGFIKTSEGTHTLKSGREMSCVYMRKKL